MGPLTLADFIGLDVCLAILRMLESGFGDPKYRPWAPPRLRVPGYARDDMSVVSLF